MLVTSWPLARARRQTADPLEEVNKSGYPSIIDKTNLETHFPLQRGSIASVPSPVFLNSG